jgi:hypothetical protein
VGTRILTLGSTQVNPKSHGNGSKTTNKGRKIFVFKLSAVLRPNQTGIVGNHQGEKSWFSFTHQQMVV